MFQSTSINVSGMFHLLTMIDFLLNGNFTTSHCPIVIASTFLQSEMRLFGGIDIAVLKQHFGKKIMEIEEEKRIAQVK